MLDAVAELEIRNESQKLSDVVYFATTGFVFPLIRQKTNNMGQIDRNFSSTMFLNQNEILAGLGLGFLGHQGQLPPVSAAGEHLPPPVQGGDAWGKHDVEFFQEAKSTLAACRVVACQSLLQQVPLDGEAGAGLPQLVHVPAQGLDKRKNSPYTVLFKA